MSRNMADSIDCSDRGMVLNNPVICIVGPTASGKSELAQQVALRIGGEVISADSMQVYKGMDIGTGKVLPSERLVQHHGLDLIEPGQPYSAALFQDYARACFREIDARGKRNVLCGGTGFYVRAAIDDYDFPAGEQVGNATRSYYNERAEEMGAHGLWCLLNERDPQSAALIPENDVKRVVRAFELLEEGTTYAAQREGLKTLGQFVDAVMVGLHVDPQVLRRRIDDRVDAMFEQGLVDEVRGLLDAGLRDGITAPQAIGYREVVSALEGEISFDEACDQIKTATHRYAKRQRTWFRKDKRISWIDVTCMEPEDTVAAALDIVVPWSHV